MAPCRDPSEGRNTNPDGAPVETYLQRHHYAFEVQERVMQGWHEVAPCRFPVRLATTIRTGAPEQPTFNVTPTPLKFKNELLHGGMKWSSSAIQVRLATPIRTEARVELNLRHPYAFEVERVMPGWDEVAQCRDTGEARNANPDGGTSGAVTPSPQRL